MRTALLLLCLLWSLVEVHSQTQYPYVSIIRGSAVTLPNHAYVNLSLVGEKGNDSVRCHTDLDECCSGSQGIHRGDWIPPGSEMRLPFMNETSAGIYQFQGRQRVVLRRKNNADMPSVPMPSGIYRCDIPTINATHDDNDTTVRESVYVGLYATGGDVTISGGITFNEDSDLNGPNPQFTLTCISTGGPATNVTWARDSDTITEGNRTVLDDPVTAQYTHTLTVTRRLGGLYTCTVANDKPSQDSANFTIQVLAQPIITAGTTTTTSISLSWTSAGSEVDSYEVMWQRDTSEECPDGDEGSISLTDASTSYDIMGLEEGSSYNITVTARNAASSSAVSNTVTALTLEAAPSGPPTSVNGTSTSTTITVQWEAVDCIHRNGDITGYSVQYEVVGSTQTMSVSGGSVTEATITLLSNVMSPTNYMYFTQVAAVNSAGIGVYSDLLPVYTERDITISGNITFNEDSDLNGPSPQFTLICISTGGPATTVTWTRGSNTVTEGTETVLDDPVTARYIHTLTVTGRLGGLYTCTVANDKLSQDSAELSVQVARPLTNVTVTASGNTVTVMWSISSSGDDITGYLVYYHHPNYNATIRSISTNVHSDTFTEHNDFQRVYAVSVQALSRHFSSALSGPVTARVPGHVQNQLLKIVMDGSLSISWEKPAQPNDYTLNYTVSVTDISTGTELNRTVLNETQLTVALSDTPLIGVPFNVTVFATNGRGNGESVSELVYGEEDGGVSPVAPAAAAGVIAALILVIVITASILLIILRWRVSRGSVKVKSKPLPPLKSLTKRERDEEEEKMKMRELVASTEEDKDDYYFEDPSNIMTARQDIPEAEFPDYVKQMHQDGDKKFNLEFQSLDKLPQPASKVAHLSYNTPHNRFKNIYPYDSTRVKLTGDPAVEGSDYINASFIEGYPDKQNAYIAAQGPTKQTVGRFWQMVWENQLTTIVMLTRCVEDGKIKCEQYWPDQLNSTMSIGSEFTVTVTSFVPSAEYQVRKLLLRSVSDPEQELSVTHMYYTAWPDHGVPRNAMSIISFIHRVRKEHPASLDLPLLLHCSAGVGRTGTFILLDSVMQQIKREGTLSVFTVLKKIRGQRMKMVQTKTQYVFIHDSLSELVVCGQTDIVAADIRIIINKMMRQVAGDTENGFQKEFQTLEKVSAQCKASCLEAEAQYNANKNRFSDKLPNELGRVRLRYSHKHGSDYINASFIDGYKQLRAYIATQGPLQGTVEAFWRMVWEHHCSCVIMLCEEMENGEESCHCFWPQGSGAAGVDGAEEVYGKLAVSVRKVSSHGDITERRLEVEERGEKETHRVVTLLQMTGWSPQELPHPSAMLALVDLLSKAQRSSPSKHTIIMCSDGVGRTGTFICLHSQLERLKTEGVVDFFQAVKSARIKRAGLVPDAAHYAFCHDVVASYVDSFETYANFKEVV